MGKLVVTEFISLDGVIEDPGGAEGFKYGGWTFEFDSGEEGMKFKLDELMSSDAQLLGRITYEGFARAWPTIEAGDFGVKMNSMPKYVVSSTLTEPTWQNTTVLSGDLARDVGALKAQYQGDILVAGSARLVQGLIEHDLVDELHLMTFPVVLGTGKQLFGETTDKKRFSLVESKQLGGGVVVSVLTKR
jgi:dihydrofolate reductase